MLDHRVREIVSSLLVGARVEKVFYDGSGAILGLLLSKDGARYRLVAEAVEGECWDERGEPAYPECSPEAWIEVIPVGPDEEEV